MPICKVPGAEIRYDTAGDLSHPPLLFIHAGVATRAMWDPQFVELARDHFVVRYDTRGFGESPGENEGFADRHDVLAILDEVEVQRATIIGASRGGRIALDTTLDSPDRVAGLVTVGTTPGGQVDEGEATPRELEMVSQMQAAIDAGDYEELVRIEVAYWDLGPTRDVGDVDPEFLARAIELNVGAAHWDFDGLDQPLEPAAVSRLHEVAVPALVVVGDHDPTEIRIGYELLLAGIPQAEGYRFADSAHLPSVEHPARFTKLLRDFLAKNAL